MKQTDSIDSAALRMGKPPVWRLLLGRALPLPDVVGWEMRQAMLIELRSEYDELLAVYGGKCMQTDFLLGQRFGADWQLVEAALLEVRAGKSGLADASLRDLITTLEADYAALGWKRRYRRWPLAYWIAVQWLTYQALLGARKWYFAQ